MAHAHMDTKQDHMPTLAAHTASCDQRTRSDDSWVEIASQPSSSSLSSVADEIVTTGLRVQHSTRSNRRRRTLRPNEALSLNLPKRQESSEGTSSQEEYDESESESDRVMSSSGEGPHVRAPDSDDENRTAVNYPINTDSCFTPQPNAFSHPPGQMRSTSQPTSGSYFPTVARTQSHAADRSSHMPRNILAPSYNATVHHDEALRASLSTLLSCAAAARGLKDDNTTTTTSTSINKRVQPVTLRTRGDRVEPMTLRLIPESALPVSLPLPDPVFRPTLRRASTATMSTSPDRKETKRRSRPSSKERRAIKKARHSSTEELYLTPTLLTWVVSAGVVVFLSALSFSAGYSLGKETGRLEALDFTAGDDVVRNCAREAGRSSLGLKRSLARTAVQV